MDYLQALILSVVEGLSEFLPISSTGHLVLTSHLLGVTQDDFTKSFEIIIQLGAILAVTVIYWRDLIQNPKLWSRIMAAFLPTAVIGLLLYKVIKEYLLGNEMITVLALGVGGVVLIGLELLYKEKETHLSKIEELSLPKAALIGLAQSLSIIPGVSRAAATIVGGLFLGLKRETAVQFSFLLAIPTMAAATGLDVLKTKISFTSYEWSLLAVGFIGSFVVALLVVKWFLKYVQKNNFIPFGVYRIIVALAYWYVLLK